MDIVEIFWSVLLFTFHSWIAFPVPANNVYWTIFQSDDSLSLDMKPAVLPRSCPPPFPHPLSLFSIMFFRVWFFHLSALYLPSALQWSPLLALAVIWYFCWSHNLCLQFQWFWYNTHSHSLTNTGTQRYARYHLRLSHTMEHTLTCRFHDPAKSPTLVWLK